MSVRCQGATSNWFVTYIIDEHCHGSWIDRLSLRYFRHQAAELLVARTLHNVPLSSLLSQQRHINVGSGENLWRARRASTLSLSTSYTATEVMGDWLLSTTSTGSRIYAALVCTFHPWVSRAAMCWLLTKAILESKTWISSGRRFIQQVLSNC